MYLQKCLTTEAAHVIQRLALHNKAGSNTTQLERKDVTLEWLLHNVMPSIKHSGQRLAYSPTCC